MPLSPEWRVHIQNGHRINTFIWLALVLSIFIYNAIVLFLDVVPETDPGLSPIFEIVLAGAGAVSLVLAVVIKRIILSPNKKPSVEGQSLVTALIAFYRNALVVQWAIAESLALYGLVGAMVVGNRLFLFLMSGAALAAMMFFRPTLAGLEAYVTRMMR